MVDDQSTMRKASFTGRGCSKAVPPDQKLTHTLAAGVCFAFLLVGEVVQQRGLGADECRARSNREIIYEHQNHNSVQRSSFAGAVETDAAG